MLQKNKIILQNNHRGITLIFVMIFGFIAFATITLGIVSYAIFQSSTTRYLYRRDLSFHLAEAGIDYYHWHLIQFPEDYTGGTKHNYYDKNGDLVGKFLLEIDAPIDGTHVVGVRSTGILVDAMGNEINSKPRIIEAYFAYESFSDSSFVIGSDIIFSVTSVTHGKIFSNGCIEFNGVSDNFVQSAKTLPQCPTSSGGNGGVFGIGSPTSFWQYPVPYKDFPAMSTNFSDLYDMSITSDGRFLSAQSSTKGWHLIFLPNGTYNTYKVKTFSKPNYTITSETFVDNKPIPTNGVIYSDSNMFVEGVVKGRVTVASDGGNTLVVYNNLIYFQKYSDDVIGLMSDGDIKVAYSVPTDMEINAVLLSANGKVVRDNYGGSSGIRNSLSFFGSIISRTGSGFKYLDNNGHIVSGFTNTIYTYDGNLLYKPPIGIPVIPQYRLVSWREVK
ncbi:MAG: hypothetical protein WC025_01430 [Candidatus Magasanikbacteria bacterium]